MSGEHLVDMSGKMLSLDRLLKYLYTKGHKALLFCQLKGSLDIIEDIFYLRGKRLVLALALTKQYPCRVYLRTSRRKLQNCGSPQGG